MTSGIYQLTFPSGNFYIGKSVDIEKRWEQHWNKFSKGRHTANMQAEFNKYGDYKCKVIFYCHVDHIDIAEETFISRLRPTLNGTFPADRLEGYYNESFDLICSYFDRSTVDHILELEDCKNRVAVLENYKTAAKAYVESLEKTAEQYEEGLEAIEEQKEVIASLQAAQKELEKAIALAVKARDAEEIAADVSNRITTLEKRAKEDARSIGRLEAECNKLTKEAYQLFLYKQLPWYKKIFN